MSLKSKLSGTKETDKEFQKIVKRVTPDKKIIKTVSGVNLRKSYVLEIFSQVIKEYNRIFYTESKRGLFWSRNWFL